MDNRRRRERRLLRQMYELEAVEMDIPDSPSILRAEDSQNESESKASTSLRSTISLESENQSSPCPSSTSDTETLTEESTVDLSLFSRSKQRHVPGTRGMRYIQTGGMKSLRALPTALSTPKRTMRWRERLDARSMEIGETPPIRPNRQPPSLKLVADDLLDNRRELEITDLDASKEYEQTRLTNEWKEQITAEKKLRTLSELQALNLQDLHVAETDPAIVLENELIENSLTIDSPTSPTRLDDMILQEDEW